MTEILRKNGFQLSMRAAYGVRVRAYKVLLDPYEIDFNDDKSRRV